MPWARSSVLVMPWGRPSVLVVQWEHGLQASSPLVPLPEFPEIRVRTCCEGAEDNSELFVLSFKLHAACCSAPCCMHDIHTRYYVVSSSTLGRVFHAFY